MCLRDVSVCRIQSYACLSCNKISTYCTYFARWNSIHVFKLNAEFFWKQTTPYLFFFIQHCIIYKVFFKVYCSFVFLFLFTYRTQNNNCFSSNLIALRSRYWIYIYLDIIWNCDYVINLHWMVSRDLIYLYIL